MARRADQDVLRLDEAARAGWLYYVAGNTQDEVARKLGISRQAAQRLVSLAISERLIKVRLDHPIARCMELAAALKLRYDLRFCDVAPTNPDSTSSTLGIAQAAAAEFERWLRRSEPAIIGTATGRTMRAVADQLPAMECPQDKLVALAGTTKTDGSASFYDEGTNLRVAGAPLRKAGNRLVIGVAMGPSRRAPLRAALTGGLISGLVTDEATAEHLLQR
jgi:DNA-binding transcriptional regulator LsrR (DeoR family)